MRELFLAYRVFPDGDSRPETIVAVQNRDFAAAARALAVLAAGDAPELRLDRDERWSFVARDDAPAADWDAIAPADARFLPF